jgi:hypothetical protein
MDWMTELEYDMKTGCSVRIVSGFWLADVV